jgi:hypothetical protein
MSLYNMIHGANPATFFVLPMLGKHGEQYPRFRDCFIVPHQYEMRETPALGSIPLMVPRDGEDAKPDGNIYVLTRVGGGNRDDYSDAITELRAMPTYVEDYDDPFDATFATFVFKVPEEWAADFEHVKEGDWHLVSAAYRDRMKAVYPKLFSAHDNPNAAAEAAAAE